MESCGDKESGAVYAVSDCKGGFVVFYALEESEVEPQQDGEGESLNGLFSFPLYDAVVGSCNGNTRC